MVGRDCRIIVRVCWMWSISSHQRQSCPFLKLQDNPPPPFIDYPLFHHSSNSPYNPIPSHHSQSFSDHYAWVERQLSSVSGRLPYSPRILHKYDIGSFSGFIGYSLKAPSSVIDAVRENPIVEYVVRDQIATAFGEQASPPSWGLTRTSQKKLDLTKPYYFNSDGSNVTVYIIGKKKTPLWEGVEFWKNLNYPNCLKILVSLLATLNSVPELLLVPVLSAVYLTMRTRVNSSLTAVSFESVEIKTVTPLYNQFNSNLLSCFIKTVMVLTALVPLVVVATVLQRMPSWSVSRSFQPLDPVLMLVSLLV